MMNHEPDCECTCSSTSDRPEPPHRPPPMPNPVDRGPEFRLIPRFLFTLRSKAV